jgi:hypothetical protein
LLNV